MSEKKKRDVVINIKPFNIDAIRVNSSGFTLEFLAVLGDDYSRRKIVRVELEWWWMRHIVKSVKEAYFKQKNKFISYGKEAGFEDDK